MAYPALVVDTRQQAGKHEVKHRGFEQMGFRLVRSKLPYGDYSFIFPASVDTKRDIQELNQDVTWQHDRFVRELESARDDGVQLVVLTENVHGITSVADLSCWTEPERELRKRNGKTPISGARLAKALATMSVRYGVRWAFCKPEEAADRTVRILAGYWAQFEESMREVMRWDSRS